ncbi:MAG: aminoglycoside phosphotransferase family protein (plasmid) [Candidatus Manganitrophus sp.]|nr:aminoglycoside phosphotransferase family protein [Candidatus Manganitrophus sp.]MDC4228193.1 aminoglycoside phosphotransferase family protein [Candidatus Manganitrophus sp.]WDT77714.1 MAG: aminoglycoside phosphotransferase family protein [Candidatus Manganitrophus sp.]
MVLDDDIPHDAALPQLADVLNRSKMKALFQAEFFPEGRFRIEACSIERVKYKPGKNCLVCYRLEIRDRMTQQVFTQRLSTRIFEKGGAISRFKKAQLQNGVMPVLGRGVSHLPALDMVVWVFPNDRKLQGLPKITDSIYLKEKLLPDLMRSAFGPEWIISELSNEVVHYVPEHTCTVRVSLRLKNSESNRTKVMTLYGKTYYNEEGREAHRMMAQLWDAEIRRTEQFRMAEPLGYDPKTKSLWQIGLPGGTLLDQEMTAPCFPTLLEGAAASVSALHHSGLSCSRSVDLSDWVVKLEEMRRVLPTVWPSCREMLHPLVDRLALQSKQFKTHSAVTLHGDLHFKNFLVDGEKVSLIDLDNLCHGAPLQDIGSFLAGLFYRGILKQTPIERIEKIGDLFVRYYEKRVPWTVSRSELGWYTAAALINERAFRCLTRLKPGRREILDRLIRLADRISFESSEFGILSWRKQDGNFL